MGKLDQTYNVSATAEKVIEVLHRALPLSQSKRVDFKGIYSMLREHDQAEVDLAIRFLKDFGLADVHYGPSKRGSLRLTHTGLLFAEHGKTFAQALSDGQSIVDLSTQIIGDIQNSNIALHSPGATQSVQAPSAAFDCLSEMRKALGEDRSLDPRKRDEAIQDIESIESELKREAPRAEILKSYLKTLSEFAGIAQLSIEVSKLIFS
jgi:hypothetical protein